MSVWFEVRSSDPSWLGVRLCALSPIQGLYVALIPRPILSLVCPILRSSLVSSKGTHPDGTRLGESAV